MSGSHGKRLKTTNPKVERNTQNTATMNAQTLRALVLTLVRLRLPVSNTGLVVNASLSAIVPILLKLSLLSCTTHEMVFIQHKLQTLLAIAWPQTLALNFKVSQFLNGNHKIELFFGGLPAQIRPKFLGTALRSALLLVFVSGCVRNLPTAALFGSLCRLQIQGTQYDTVT